MRIFFIPLKICFPKRANNSYARDAVFLHRVGERPRIIMRDLKLDVSGMTTNSHGRKGDSGYFRAYGELVDGWSFMDMREDDRLFFMTDKTYGDGAFDPFYMDVTPTEDMLLPGPCEGNALSMAAILDKRPDVIVAGKEKVSLADCASRAHKSYQKIYEYNEAYRNIMLKAKGAVECVSLAELVARQDPSRHPQLESLLFAISSTGFRTKNSIIKNVLELCESGEGFSLFTQEEQVGTFIDFSRMVARKKVEYVSDALISRMERSPEYARVKQDLTRNGLGLSATQQFNVFQSVGYLSGNPTEKIIYNLSDMGAGKTLMTVESIYMLDLKQLSNYQKQRATIPEDVEVVEVTLPDKHIIAPTLSVKSSWIQTFKLFYDVEKVEDTEYKLSLAYEGEVYESRIYISSFTVRNGSVYITSKLPYAPNGTYLIIDEIHQLVSRQMAKSRFFTPNTNPSVTYNTFVLSGTMSNMTAKQWFNLTKFLGLSLSDTTVAKAKASADEKLAENERAIRQSASMLRTAQHRYFDTDDVTPQNYCQLEQKKMTAIESEFYAKYGAQIVQPLFRGKGSLSMEELFGNEDGSRFNLTVNPLEADSVNFELFYSIIGSHAVTAQSAQVAEELFGKQKTQHKADIIKTVSPLSMSDVKLLKVLHRVASDHVKYKSVAISKAINNAILNLNDGLQTKNLYQLVSDYAERNIRFFEYLTTLDVNVLEQLPLSGLIATPKLEETQKFKVLQDILKREKDETHLIVVNDYYALKSLSEALGIEHLTKDQLKRELDYQEILDDLFEKQSIVIVTQDMIKSSLDLVQANRLIQYQLNTEISDIIQTQNRINRVGQTRETRGYYIASDQLQENLIERFLESYRNIRVAHKGIVELFTDITSQVNVVNDYLEQVFKDLESDESVSNEVGEPEEESDLAEENALPEGMEIVQANGTCVAILYPNQDKTQVIVPTQSGQAFLLGILRADVGVFTAPTKVMWDLKTNTMVKNEVESEDVK